MKLPRPVLAIGVPVLVAIISWYWAVGSKPETTAYVGHCIQRIDGGLGNGCDEAVVGALCRKTDGSDRREDNCAYQTLDPGQSFDRALNPAGAGQPYTLACWAPFEPLWRPSAGNYNRYEKRCRKPA